MSKRWDLQLHCGESDPSSPARSASMALGRRRGACPSPIGFWVRLIHSGQVPDTPAEYSSMGEGRAARAGNFVVWEKQKTQSVGSGGPTQKTTWGRDMRNFSKVAKGQKLNLACTRESPGGPWSVHHLARFGQHWSKIQWAPKIADQKWNCSRHKIICRWAPLFLTFIFFLLYFFLNLFSLYIFFHISSFPLLFYLIFPFLFSAFIYFFRFYFPILYFILLIIITSKNIISFVIFFLFLFILFLFSSFCSYIFSFSHSFFN